MAILLALVWLWSGCNIERSDFVLVLILWRVMAVAVLFEEIFELGAGSLSCATRTACDLSISA